MKTGIIEFIEYCEKRKKDNENEYTIFTVNVDTGFKNLIYLPSFGKRYDEVTFSLDDEDLEYLYNKYLPYYKEAVIERDERNILRKEKEIKKLEEQLNKLKNER